MEELQRRLEEEESKSKTLQVELEDLQATLTEETWLVGAQKEKIAQLMAQLESQTTLLASSRSEWEAERVRLTGDCDRLAGQVGAMQEEKQNWLADLRQLGEEKHAWEQEKHQLLKAAQAQRQASDGDAQALSSASYGEAGENGHAENVAGGASESPVSSDLRDRHEAESLRDEQAALVEEKTRLATMNAELAERVAVLQKEQEQGTRQADGLKRELEKQKEIHERQLEAYRADHDALSQKVQALRVDAEAHTDQIGVLQRVRDTLERDVQALTAERDALMQKVTSLEQDMVDRAQRQQGAERELSLALDESRSAHGRLSEHLAAVQRHTHEVESELGECKKIVKRLGDQVDALEQEKAETAYTLREVKANAAQLSQHNKDLEGIRDMLRQELSDAQQQIDDLGARWSESARKLKEVEADYKKASVANTAMVAEVAETKGQFKILSAAAGEREAESIDLKIKVAQLREELDEQSLVNRELCQRLQDVQQARPSIQLPARAWQADHEAVNCSDCNDLFSITTRKHHCRACGYAVDSLATCHKCWVFARVAGVP